MARKPAPRMRVVQKIKNGETVVAADFGIVGDGVTPDDKGAASLSAALSDYHAVTLADAPVLLVTETARFDNRHGFRLRTTRLPNTTTNRDEGPGFRWGGPDGGDVVSLNRTAGAELSGWKIETEDFFHRWGFAKRGLVLDGGQDTGPGAAIGSSCTLRHLRHVTYPHDLAAQSAIAALSTDERRRLGIPRSSVLQARLLARDVAKATRERKSGVRGDASIAATFIAISQESKDNHELHRIEKCGGNGNGRGSFLDQGPSYNIKNTKLFDSWYIDAYERAVQMDNGSLKLRDNNMSANVWDLWLGFATNFVREVGHLGEASLHHAFINCAYYGMDNTLDIQRTQPRRVLIPDPMFAPGDPNYHDYPNAFILFGPFAAVVRLGYGAIEAPPRDTTKPRDSDGNYPVKDARVFGWMNDDARTMKLGPFALGYGHTRRTLGIDEETLTRNAVDPETGGYYPYPGRFTFHGRAHERNPYGPDISGLETGELQFGGRGVTVESIPDESALPPEKHTVAPTVILTASTQDAAKAAVQKGGVVAYRAGQSLNFQEARPGESKQRNGTIGVSK
jgi:hypothetical protein